MFFPFTISYAKIFLLFKAIKLFQTYLNIMSSTIPDKVYVFYFLL